MIRRVVLLAVLAAAVSAPVANAATATWSVTDLENQLMCPVCNTLLNNSQSTAANRIRARSSADSSIRSTAVSLQRASPQGFSSGGKASPKYGPPTRLTA